MVESVVSTGAPGALMVGVIVELAQVLVGMLVAALICQVPEMVLQTWYVGTTVAVPEKVAIGSKVTSPETVLTVYVPSVVVRVVRVQFGTDSLAAQSRTDAGFNATVPETVYCTGIVPAESLVNGLIETVTVGVQFAEPVSGVAATAGCAATTGVTVLVATCPRVS